MQTKHVIYYVTMTNIINRYTARDSNIGMKNNSSLQLSEIISITAQNFISSQ